eukprot:Clim_evm139s149 gene=Clim_evmTU139s149
MQVSFSIVLALFASAVSAEKLIDLKCLFITSEGLDSDTQAYEGFNYQFDVLEIPSTGLSGDIELFHGCTDGDNFHAKYSCIVKQPTIFGLPDGTFADVFTAGQYEELYEYQRQTGARMVELEVWPWRHGGSITPNYGTFSTAQLSYDISGMTRDSPIDVTLDYFNAGEAVPAVFETNNIQSVEPVWSLDGTNYFAAAIITFTDGRQVYESFHSAGNHWRWEAAAMSHAWSLWVTQDTYTGSRLININTQIDDHFLSSPVYRTNADESYDRRITARDMQQHIRWMNAMPRTDDYRTELVFNGNGAAIKYGQDYIDTTEEEFDLAWAYGNTPKDWRKPLTEGYNDDTWPTNYTSPDVEDLLSKDGLLRKSFRRFHKFYWVSHTYSHLALNNISYYDAYGEVAANAELIDDLFAGAIPDNFSPYGIVSGQISGLFNGDNLRAWDDNGLMYAVGDNSYGEMLRPNGIHRGFYTSNERNGHAGIYVMPRHATNIFFPCDTIASEEALWNELYLGVYFDRYYYIDDILAFESDAAAMNTMEGRRDAYMFHQVNMVIEEDGKSLLIRWVDAVIAKLRTVFTLPVVTYKHDKLAQDFIFRDNQFACAPTVTMVIGDNGEVTAVETGSSTGTCEFEVTGFSSISGARSSRTYGPDKVHNLHTGDGRASVSGGPVLAGSLTECPAREETTRREVTENVAKSGKRKIKKQQRQESSGCAKPDDSEIENNDEVCAPAPAKKPANLVTDPQIPNEDRQRRRYYRKLRKQQRKQDKASEQVDCNQVYCDSELNTKAARKAAKNTRDAEVNSWSLAF